MAKNKKILVCGGLGFIGHHLAKVLWNQGHHVVAVDIKSEVEFGEHQFCTEVLFNRDLSKIESWRELQVLFGRFDEIYQLAADMGGAGYIFTGNNDFQIMYNSVSINIHCAMFASRWKSKVFYSSSACIYPSYNQEDPSNPKCSEDSAYPANPDSEYGWEKLFSERLYLSAYKNLGLSVRIARFHNIFGPEGTYKGGKEKAPAALCRKIAEVKNGDTIEVWGPGNQTRSFLFIDECIEGILRLMESDFIGPVNIGSEEMISINGLANLIISISGKKIIVNNVPGPVGVMGRNSDNTLLRQKLGWSPSLPLEIGLRKTYDWISKEVMNWTE